MPEARRRLKVAFNDSTGGSFDTNNQLYKSQPLIPLIRDAKRCRSMAFFPFSSKLFCVYTRERREKNLFFLSDGRPAIKSVNRKRCSNFLFRLACERRDDLADVCRDGATYRKQKQAKNSSPMTARKRRK
jgi:hypothetical protein